mgnify:CR=1 FL=1|jgi:hypothetical protein|tara:strand:+ start:4569 stop:4808 length:240 start_codon:yes stop_codon:yes gene_type:complete
MPSTTEYEREHLEAHVDLCAIRYAHLNERLEKVEAAVVDLHTGVVKGNKGLVKAMIVAVSTIVVALVGAVATIISSMPV